MKFNKLIFLVAVIFSFSSCLSDSNNSKLKETLNKVSDNGDNGSGEGEGEGSGSGPGFIGGMPIGGGSGSGPGFVGGMPIGGGSESGGAGESEKEPLWKRTHQESWYYGASIHADNTPYGTPARARKVWDDIIQIDPEAPMHIRPFYAIKTGGASPLYDAFYQEIKNRNHRGYRVIYTLKKGTADDLIRDVAEMAKRDSLPWGVGLWNELDFGGRNSPDEFEKLIRDAKLVEALIYLNKTYGVKVTPPGIASFRNLIENGYGEVIRNLFKDVPRSELFIKVHSYGHLQPKHWVTLNLKDESLAAVGLPKDGVIILEETANTFVSEHGSPKPGVYDEQGAEFLRAAMYAGMQVKIPTCHFMLYHKFSNFNNISDPVYGDLRRREAMGVLEYVRATNDINPPGSTDLKNPMGRELD